METKEYYGGTYPSQPEQREFVVTFNIYGKASATIFADSYEDAERIAKETFKNANEWAREEIKQHYISFQEGDIDEINVMESLIENMRKELNLY